MQFQPSLRREAIIAATGPVTLAQTEDLQVPILLVAMRKANVKSSGLNQPSHHAVAQWRSGAVCASKAGSRVPLAPSNAYKVASGFLPPACGAAAAATLDRVTWRAELDKPAVSQPNKMAEGPEALTICFVLTPNALKA